jgi:hypothetical protein
VRIDGQTSKMYAWRGGLGRIATAQPSGTAVGGVSQRTRSLTLGMPYARWTPRCATYTFYVMHQVAAFLQQDALHYGTSPLRGRSLRCARRHRRTRLRMLTDVGGVYSSPYLGVTNWRLDRHRNVFCLAEVSPSLSRCRVSACVVETSQPAGGVVPRMIPPIGCYMGRGTQGLTANSARHGCPTAVGTCIPRRHGYFTFGIAH